MANRLVHVFYGTDMRCAHPGLIKIAAEAKVHLVNLKPGDLLCFINNKRDKIKVLAPLGEEDSEGVVAYYKSPHGRIDSNSVQFIPRAFDGSRLDMNSAIKSALLKRLNARG